jgi:tRNA(Arg) A34 adenosine deaminase TadA
MTRPPFPDVRRSLPLWIPAYVDVDRRFEGDAAKAALAIDLSRRNVAAGTGGPFGAAVFGPDDRVVGIGVNAVLPLACSIAHAEILALATAQRVVGRPRLNRDAEDRLVGPCTRAASSQPCCQCYGAIIWAGLDRLVMGARTEDVTSLSDFDEGPLPDDWIGELQRRGIETIRDVCREEAREVLRAYRKVGGPSY